MSSFFSCFSCGDKQSTITPTNIIPVKALDTPTPNQHHDLNALREFQDDKSRSATTLTFRTTDTFPNSNLNQDSYIRNKIENIRKKDLPERKAMESEFVKQNLTKSSIIYLVEKQWSEQYTAFLKNIDQKEIRSINNFKLTDEKGNLRSDIREKEHYFIINERIWKFVQQMYGGGPSIAKDGYFPIYLLGPKKLQLGVIGMVNPKYLCYMISVMQCLLSISHFSYFFLKKLYVDGNDSKKKSLHYTLHKMVKQVVETDDVKIQLKELSSFVQNKFSSYEQHDAHEFFLHLTNLIQQECKPESQYKNEQITGQQLTGQQPKDPQSAYTAYFKNNHSIVDKLFAGQTETLVTCCRCQTVSSTFIPFLDIQLEMVDNTLENCLRKHFSQEKLDDLYDCQKCIKKTKATKQYSITKTPNYLLIVLKKFQQNGKKIEERVKYPLELDLKKFCKGHYGQSKYLLQSVLVHKGVKSTKGHYYCYTKRAKKAWYYINDELYKEIEANDCLGRDAYMLFYERFK